MTEIEVKPDGSWRVKAKSEIERRELGAVGQWHFPDGTLCVSNDGDEKPKATELLKQVKQEGVSEGHTGLKLGIRKNRNGFWEVSKPEDMNTSSGNILPEKFGNHEQKVIPMSSSATGSARDDEDPSVNQDGGGNFDFSNNGVEMETISLNVDSAYGIADQNLSVPIGDAEVIVLSDSDEDNDIFISSGSGYKNHRTGSGGVNFSVPPPVITDSYADDPALGTGGSSCLGLFNGNDDEFGMPLWHLPPGNQAGPGFQLFSTDADVSDALDELQHGTINCSTSMNGYTMVPDTAMGSAALAPNSSIGRSDTDINDGLVDNPLAFAGEDPSLQIFLPTRPSDVSMQSDFRDQADMSNGGVRTEDWISLRLGDGASGSGSNGQSVAPNGLNTKQQVSSRDGVMDSLPDPGSFNFLLNNFTLLYLNIL